jgi:peptide chain release factor 1
MNTDKESEFKLDRSLVIKNYIRSQGPGGQHVNRTESCVQLTHTPSGIQVKCQDTRDQRKNEIIAWERLTEKLKFIEDQKNDISIKNFRNDQIGKGGRGAKRRTYRIKDGVVTDHITGKSCRWEDFLKGKIELLI